jgi:hypothetical protein
MRNGTEDTKSLFRLLSGKDEAKKTPGERYDLPEGA